MATYSYSVETLEAVLSLCTLDEFNKLSSFISNELPLYKSDEKQKVYEIFWTRLEQLTYTSNMN